MDQTSPVKKNQHIPGPPLGWPLLPVPDNGTLAFPVPADSIKQSIRIILLTRPGEQLMRPAFGAGLSRFLHLPNTLETRRQIQETVLDALTRWEQRITVRRVEVWEDEATPEAVRIEIAYKIRRTGEPVTTTVTLNLGS
ncbi:GPW/gp25 family protein [Desulfatitalea alkaliphila]|uniref:GPW/gp25 family protein n=1 Tax=Desulfatitalea alkaliphila TaxID=2929485 RepID=A0AA41R1M2_9BACT|nr:GPW/gp25 family protein [Desulfatitalea alkaliphila]MCJ8500103.1 GPW/gp25 family protein [Desulfatitalea alkaliphila]